MYLLIRMMFFCIVMVVLGGVIFKMILSWDELGILHDFFQMIPNHGF